MSTDRKNFLTHQQFAVLFGIEPRTATKWVNELGCPKEGRGQYNLVAVVHWRCGYLENKIRELEAGGIDGMNQRIRLNRVNAEIKELQLAKLRRALVDLDEITPILTTALNNVRQSAIPFAQTIAPQLEGLNSQERTELIRDRLYYELFEELTRIPDALRRLVSLDEHRTAESVQRSQAAAKNDGKRTRRSASHTKQGRRRTRARKVSR